MKVLLTHLLVFTLLVAVSVGQGRAAAGGSATAPQESPKPKKIETLIEEITKLLKASKTPGMSLAIVTKDKVLFAGGIGLADVAKRTPATAEILFPLGSVTKGFTALAALKLQEQGRLDLNATLASLAPDLDFKNPWEASDPVRIVHLLEHTSGFDDVHPCGWIPDPRSDNLRSALARDPNSRTSRWRPGTRFAYTGMGTSVVAYAIEKITGEVFEDFVQREIFTPIGMKTVTYFVRAGDATLARRYDRDGVTPVEYFPFPLRPAGSGNASANDMAAYVRFYLNRGRMGDMAVLSEAALERMERPVSSTAARAGLVTGYGLYNRTSLDAAGRVWHGHHGVVAGGNCIMQYLPEVGVGYAVMVNANDEVTLGGTGRLVGNFLTQNLAKPVRPSEVKIPADVSARHAGFYIPVNPRNQMLAFVDRVSGVTRLTFDDDGALFGGAFRDKFRVVGVTPTLLRWRSQVAATFVLIEPTEVDDASLVSSPGFSTSYRRVPTAVAFAPHALLVAAVILILSTLILSTVWLLQGCRKKISWREHLGLRLWPLAATLAIGWFAGAIALAIAETDSARANVAVERYGRISVWSLDLAAAGVIALALACVGLVVVLRASGKSSPRWLYWHAVLVLATLSTLTLYLAANGVVPMVTWT